MMSRANEPEETQDGSSFDTAIAQHGLTILLVDDDQDLVEMLALRLRLAGLTALLAFSPAAAIQLFEREGPDLVVLDVELGPWSGLDLLEELRKRSHVPVLMLTGVASETAEARSFQLGADEYLQKPISAASLIARILAILRRDSWSQEQAEVHVQLNTALRELVDARDVAQAEAEQAARARDELLTVAAHDLCLRLTAIEGLARLQHTQAVEARAPESDPLVMALKQIEADAAKMARQLERVARLEFGQTSDPDAGPTDLRLTRRRAVAAFRQPRPHRGPAERQSRSKTRPGGQRVPDAGSVRQPGHSTRMARILVVDDEDAIRMTVVDMLEGDGYIAVGAADGREALAILRGEHPDAIVLDLMMPVIDGWGFVERCRREPAGADVPIIVMSAAQDLSMTAKGMRALGVQACLAKPFDLEALLALVERFAPGAA
jgi:DNA-binding response OmpR family regulator